MVIYVHCNVLSTNFINITTPIFVPKRLQGMSTIFPKVREMYIILESIREYAKVFVIPFSVSWSN